VMIRKYVTVLSILAIFIVLIMGSVLPFTDALAEEPEAGNKISSILAAQVAAKSRAMQAGGVQAALDASQQAGFFDMLQTPDIRLEDPSQQRIFIHLSQEPSQSQLDELRTMGITPHPDSWIPPVGAHPTGFILADMPIDRLANLASKGYVARLDSAEQVHEPQNDLAAAKTNADDVWTAGYDGTGVTIAVLDSGFQIGSGTGHAARHPDFPAMTAGTDYKDYSSYPTLDDDVANIYGITGHGTHVAGTALGRGTQSTSGVYKGSAPDADPVFLKIGNDSTGSASYAAEVAAIQAAAKPISEGGYEADVITMSYGGWSTHMDGTSQPAQAIDYAVSQGAVVFISAGNEANDDQHYSGTVAGSGTTSDIQIDVTGAGTNDTYLWFNLVWYDGTSTNNELSGHLYNSSHGTINTINETQSESTRGTEARWCYYVPSQGSLYYLPSGSSTYYLQITNGADTSQDFHVYVWADGAGSVTFNSPDPDYTLGSPANADSAIAVGSYNTRQYWWDYDNNSYWFPTNPVDQISTFSSRGPRVDTGAPPAPAIVAPGCGIISCRDEDAYPWPSGANYYYIDNDGPNENSTSKNDGNGPAEYYMMTGTSMACPHAAGIGALILDKNPGWTPAQVKHALEANAVEKGTPGWDTIYGWGLADALAAVNASLPPTTSYKDSGHSTECNDFSDWETEHIAYMQTTGLLASHSYRMAYYDGGNTKRATEDATSDTSGNLSTQHTFVNGTDVAGTWHVIVCDQAHTPPTTYSATWAYTINEDTFDVEDTAIPEFPTTLVAIAALATCAGIYFWLRRKAAPVSI
jgi:subtilisin family serine protease